MPAAYGRREDNQGKRLPVFYFILLDLLDVPSRIRARGILLMFNIPEGLRAGTNPRRGDAIYIYVG